ncbi:MAG: hypothetical protein IPL87_01875 [Candidatus Moraniibacteriota bacterium]|nr:MAG: hypothetical protein IPL87_01875 [Candidatus Moranbacteria bacterium]
MALLESLPRKIVSITGASGTGKSTLVTSLLQHFPEKFRLIRSVTTREPRPGEDDFFTFLSREEFFRLECAGEFLWSQENHGNFYATRRSDIDAAISLNRISLAIVSPQNIERLVEYAPQFVLPLHIAAPSDSILRLRLLSRGEHVSEIDRRLADCRKWDHSIAHLPIHIEIISNEGSLEAFQEEAIKRIFSEKNECEQRERLPA